MPSIPNLTIPNPTLKLGRRPSADVVGLDIQPGLVAAVQARVNGEILAQRAAALALAGEAVREGEVFDQDVLAETLRELFRTSGLAKRVRVGVANQRTVMRTLDLPPMTDSKELAAAVNFQAQDQVPMPLNNAVLDFHPLGVFDTPAGPRQRVLLVAAQRDMIERLLAAVRAAGLRPEGIDLSAFALIRSLHRPDADPDHAERIVYLNVDGLTNLAIAEGTTCRFTRVVGGGMEAVAGELAERFGVTLTDARALLASVDLTVAAQDTPIPDIASPGATGAPDAFVALPQADPADPEARYEPTVPEADLAGASSVRGVPGSDVVDPAFEEVSFETESFHGSSAAVGDPEAPSAHADASAEAFATPSAGSPADAAPLGADEQAERELAMSYAEHYPAAGDPALAETAGPPGPSEADVRKVLENGIREISGQVRTSLEFHRSQDAGSEVSHVVLSGSALDIPGFAEALQAALDMDVRAQTVALADPSLADGVSTHRLAVAAGLTTMEAPR
jgi:type IV pilus assembly protein PilM